MDLKHLTPLELGLRLLVLVQYLLPAGEGREIPEVAAILEILVLAGLVALEGLASASAGVVVLDIMGR